MTVKRRCALASAAVAVVASALLGAAGTASAASGAQIGLCPQGDYDATVAFNGTNQTRVPAHHCRTFSVPSSDQYGVAMTVVGFGPNGSTFVVPNGSGNNVTFVRQDLGNRHVYAYGTASGSHHYDVYDV